MTADLLPQGEDTLRHTTGAQQVDAYAKCLIALLLEQVLLTDHFQKGFDADAELTDRHRDIKFQE